MIHGFGFFLSFFCFCLFVFALIPYICWLVEVSRRDIKWERPPMSIITDVMLVVEMCHSNAECPFAKQTNHHKIYTLFHKPIRFLYNIQFET